MIVRLTGTERAISARRLGGISMNSQRFNPMYVLKYGCWNQYYWGLIQLLSTIKQTHPNGHLDMCEIGTHMGESTSIFASSGMFKLIHTLDPWDGHEEFNEEAGITWEDVENEFNINTRHWTHAITPRIMHYRSYSHKSHHLFRDESLDFVYIDGAHDYDSVKRDIELYLPKVKKGGYIGGHDYKFLDLEDGKWGEKDSVFDGSIKAIEEAFGEVDHKFSDSSWLKVVE